jgi:hypothetical protein
MELGASYADGKDPLLLNKRSKGGSAWLKGEIQGLEAEEDTELCLANMWKKVKDLQTACGWTEPEEETAEQLTARRKRRCPAQLMCKWMYIAYTNGVLTHPDLDWNLMMAMATRSSGYMPESEKELRCCLRIPGFWQWIQNVSENLNTWMQKSWNNAGPWASGMDPKDFKSGSTGQFNSGHDYTTNKGYPVNHEKTSNVTREGLGRTHRFDVIQQNIATYAKWIGAVATGHMRERLQFPDSQQWLLTVSRQELTWFVVLGWMSVESYLASQRNAITQVETGEHHMAHSLDDAVSSCSKRNGGSASDGSESWTLTLNKANQDKKWR